MFLSLDFLDHVANESEENKALYFATAVTFDDYELHDKLALVTVPGEFDL